MRRVLLLAVFVAALLAAAVAPAALAQPGERCFAETSYCIGGRIRQFWEQSGGLPVFGLPLTPLIEEQVEGRAVQLQWFERARLELHPANAPPYDVLLGRLGADLLARRGPEAPTPGLPGPGCRLFAETGQSVCGPILAAWRASGIELDGRAGVSEAESLALFGLPLTAERRETLSDGRQYSVQWFERARFERHPANAPPYDVLLGRLGAELRGAEPAPPVPVNPLPPPDTSPPVPPPDAAAARLRVPAGFSVREFAAGLRAPRLISVGPDGALYLAERGAGRVVRLPDRNRDGLADAVEPVVSDLRAPHNLEWHAGCLYVAENHQVSRHCDPGGDGVFEQRQAIVGLPTGGGHTSRTLRIGPDGKLYVAAGSSCNVCREDDPQRAAILRYNLDGSIPADNPFAGDGDPRRRAVWAEGLRNSVDFRFMPDGQLWATHNGRDNMLSPSAKDDRPLEEIVIAVQAGRHHGWPFCTSERPGGDLAPGPGPYVETPDPSRDVPATPPGFRCADAVPALFTATAHAAPLGLARYDAATFPADYRGDLFIALHGSWNRTPPAPCKVVRVQLEAGLPVAASDFLTGFQADPAQPCGDAWGRPAGVAVGADGALYVSDDQNGRIYRIVPSPG